MDCPWSHELMLRVIYGASEHLVEGRGDSGHVDPICRRHSKRWSNSRVSALWSKTHTLLCLLPRAWKKSRNRPVLAFHSRARPARLTRRDRWAAGSCGAIGLHGESTMPCAGARSRPWKARSPPRNSGLTRHARAQDSGFNCCNKVGTSSLTVGWMCMARDITV